ncbi:MAG: M23 family metallopeptidase [Bacillota bacterium]
MREISIILNLYGTWSKSQEGAHEGIDFTYTTNTPDLRSFLPNDGVAKAASGYKVAIYSANINRTIIYYHLSQINVSYNDPVSYGQVIGKQGNEGGTSSGYHLHLEAGAGIDTSLDETKYNHSLTSANIYDAIDWALHG